MKGKFNHGNYFSIDGNFFFPASLPFSKLKELANIFVDCIVTSDSYDIRARRGHKGKGIEWEIKSISLDKNNQTYLTDTYTFNLSPHWAIAEFYHHWVFINHKCELLNPYEALPNLENCLTSFLDELETCYKSSNALKENQFLLGDSWEVIFANDERGIEIEHKEPTVS
jgi:hypothetical protein